jgi:hypothetical protein
VELAFLFMVYFLSEKHLLQSSKLVQDVFKCVQAKKINTVSLLNNDRFSNRFPFLPCRVSK